jgi:hypothetical protein
VRILTGKKGGELDMEYLAVIVDSGVASAIKSFQLYGDAVQYLLKEAYKLEGFEYADLSEANESETNNYTIWERTGDGYEAIT